MRTLLVQDHVLSSTRWSQSFSNSALRTNAPGNRFCFGRSEVGPKTASLTTPRRWKCHQTTQSSKDYMTGSDHTINYCKSLDLGSGLTSPIRSTASPEKIWSLQMGNPKLWQIAQLDQISQLGSYIFTSTQPHLWSPAQAAFLCCAQEFKKYCRFTSILP